MPRTARASVGGMCYHVINRGNGRADVFHKDGDFQAFVDLIGLSCQRLPLEVFGYCLMSNHFHLVVRSADDGDLSRWMQWLLTSHVRRYHRHYRSSGHVWQGRFKAFPIQADEHLLTVLRYVERNPLRAKAVDRAEDWMWSSLRWWSSRVRPDWLSNWPAVRPRNWKQRVNQAESERELEAMRRSVNREAPYGSDRWVKLTAKRLDLEFSIRPRGRPRNQPKK